MIRVVWPDHSEKWYIRLLFGHSWKYKYLCKNVWCGLRVVFFMKFCHKCTCRYRTFMRCCLLEILKSNQKVWYRWRFRWYWMIFRAIIRLEELNWVVFYTKIATFTKMAIKYCHLQVYKWLLRKKWRFTHKSSIRKGIMSLNLVIYHVSQAFTLYVGLM